MSDTEASPTTVISPAVAGMAQLGGTAPTTTEPKNGGDAEGSTGSSSSSSWGSWIACMLVLIVLIVIIVVMIWWWCFRSCNTNGKWPSVHACNVKANGNLCVRGSGSFHGPVCATCGVVANALSGGGAPITVSDPLVVHELRYAKTTVTDATFTLGAGTYIELANPGTTTNVNVPLAKSAGEGHVYFLVNGTGGASVNVLPTGTDTLDYATAAVPFTIYAQAVSDGVSNWTVTGV